MCARRAVRQRPRGVRSGDSSPADDGTRRPGKQPLQRLGRGRRHRQHAVPERHPVGHAAAPAATPPPPVVGVTSPAGGETWKAGSTHAITWTATDNVGVTAVDLAYSTDGGASYPNIIATGLANSGTYAWTVPNAPGTTRAGARHGARRRRQRRHRRQRRQLHHRPLDHHRRRPAPAAASRPSGRRARGAGREPGVHDHRQHRLPRAGRAGGRRLGGRGDQLHVQQRDREPHHRGELRGERHHATRSPPARAPTAASARAARWW